MNDDWTCFFCLEVELAPPPVLIVKGWRELNVCFYCFEIIEDEPNFWCFATQDYPAQEYAQ